MAVEHTLPGSFAYVLVPSDFGSLSVVWREDEGGARVYRVFLPSEQPSTQLLVLTAFPGADLASCPAVAELGRRIQRFLEGEAVDFGLDIIALERCSEFQRRVLLAERGIPRGWVSTYGNIAQVLGVPGGARAVGGALARNPFPIIIPCHRAVRSDGYVGEFQGGVKMKRALLEFEGIEVTPAGRVRTSRIYYSKASSF